MQSYATKILSFAIIFLMVVSCNKNKFNKTQSSEVSFQASGNEVTLAGKPFVMETVQIDLADLKIEGERIQGDPVSLSLALPPQVDFLNPNFDGNLELPVGTYTSMIVNSQVQMNGGPSVSIEGTYYHSNGEDYEVAIALELNEDIIATAIDTDGSDLILIDEDLNKTFVFELDIETLFSDINPGLWNAAAVTSNNGSETIAVDALNNQNIYNAISGKIGESFVVRFE